MGSGTFDEDSGVETTLAVEALEATCAKILTCTRAIGIYPQGHPRVHKSLDVIVEQLQQYHRDAGVAFVLDTELVLEEPEGTPSSTTRRDRLTLAQILQLHLIAKLKLSPEVTNQELYEFSFLLQEDLLRKAENSEIAVDPSGWIHIELSFYEPKDLPDSATGGVNLIERASAAKRVHALHPLLEKLPKETRQQLRDALNSTDFLRRAASLQRRWKEQWDDDAEQSVMTVDVVANALQTILTTEREITLGPLNPDDLLGDLGEYMALAEANIESLSTGLETSPLAQGPTTFREQIRETGVIGVSSEVDPTKTHELKRRLAFLFQTRSITENIKTETPAATEPETSDQPTRRRRDETNESGVVTFPEETQTVVVEDIATDVRHLQVVLELLDREQHRETVLSNWETVLAALVDVGRDPRFAAESIEHVAAFLVELRLPEVENLLDHILFGMRRAADLLPPLEQVVLPLCGEEHLRRFLKHLAERAPRKAVGLLDHFEREATEPLRSLAETRLIALVREPTLLVVWASGNPECLARPPVQEIVEEIAPEKLRGVFREYFTQATGEEATTFLEKLPAGAPGIEHILFTAMDHGSPLTRETAMAALGRHPTAKVTQTLIEIVKLNNYREKPLSSEVEAALSALVQIDNELSRAFLRNVRYRRRWFFRVFKRSIRDTLRQLVEGPASVERAPEKKHDRRAP